MKHEIEDCFWVKFTEKIKLQNRSTFQKHTENNE